MVKTSTFLSAFALLAPFANAAPTTVTGTVTKTKTFTQTDYSISTTTKVKTVTQKTTATAPVSTVTTTSVSTASAQTVTVTQTVTPPAVTVTTTQTSTQPAVTITQTTSVTGSCVSTSSTKTTSSSSSQGTNPTTTRTALQATNTMGLNDYAKAAGGRYLGTAVDIPGTEANDPVYMAVANDTHEFGSRTPANTMKYVYTEPSRGQFDFSGGDYFIQMAHGAGINHIRCHNLVWYNQLPTWLTSQTWDNATLISIMQNHITQLITHWGDNCTHWDVVNEAFNDDGTWRQTIWYNTIGAAYIPIAYQAAMEAVQANNLSVKLYYNDYNIEAPSAKSNSTMQLVRNLTAAGIQIDGVGIQSHFIVGETWYYTTQEQNMANFAALGVEIAVTELDARVLTLPPSATDEINQFNSYKWTVTACANTPACVGVTIWDFDDTYSWVPSTFKGQGYADVWLLNQTSNSLVKKIAWDGIVDGWDNGNNY